MICEICKKEGAMFSRMEKNYCLVCWEDFLQWMWVMEAKDSGVSDEDIALFNPYKKVTDEKKQ